MKKLLFILGLLLIITLPMVFGETGFQMLEVDGIRVHIDEIRFAQGYGDSATIGSISVDQDVDLTGDLSDVFSDSATIRLEFGVSELMFDTINIWLSGGVGIKGHTFFSGDNVHIYTSASGIKSLSGATWSEPSDYGYLSISYLYYPGDDGEQSETTFLQEMTTFTGETPLDISLLVDTFQVAYYWDGQDSTRNGFVDSWHQENSSYFPAGTPVIGISYLPLYLAVNQDLTSETYIVAEDVSYLTAESADFYNEKNTMTMTLVFDDGGSFFIGRTANWDGLYTSFKLPQFVTGAAVSGSSYRLDLQNYEDGSGWIEDSTISGFSRLDVDAIGTFTFIDSTGTDYSLYSKRVK